MGKYKEIKITALPFNPDILSGFLWELDIDGLIEETDHLIIYAGEKSRINKESIGLHMKKLINNKIILSFHIEERLLENKNWNEEWEKNLRVIEVSDYIVIKPSAKDYKNEGNKIVITIDPKMSFGTGEHQTTKLVIQVLEKYIRRGMKVLDIGTGTGILSIASIKLGADFALAIDNDELCIENADENIRLNSVNKKIKIKLSELNEVSEKNFDLILANIQKNVLLNIAEGIKARINKNGILILSGLLIEDETAIAEKYQDLNFILLGKKIMDEWIALVFQNQ